MSQTVLEFFEKLRAGTADEAACIVIWHLVKTLNGSAKIDIAAPTEGWSLKLRPSYDARYVSLIAEGESKP
jgi:hypothetical protein